MIAPVHVFLFCARYSTGTRFYHLYLDQSEIALRAGRAHESRVTIAVFLTNTHQGGRGWRRVRGAGEYMGGVNLCSLHCRLANFLGLMRREKYDAVIGLK